MHFTDAARAQWPQLPAFRFLNFRFLNFEFSLVLHVQIVQFRMTADPLDVPAFIPFELLVFMTHQEQ